jgi:hypothetical protein
VRLRAALGLVALFAVVLPAVPASPACASEAPHAALVVSTGHSVLRYCVLLDQPSVSGLRLIELAHDQYGLSYRSDGAAVCMLAGVGTAEGDCFGDYPNFWGYWRAKASGGWVWAGRGAATTSVHGGQVEGWSWGRGDTGATHPAPPNSPFASVCHSSPSPVPTPSPTERAHPSSSPAPSSQPVPSPAAGHTARPQQPSRNASPAKRHRKGRRKKLLAGAGAAATPSPSVVAANPAADRTPDEGSIPGAGIAAVVAAAVLGAFGWLFVRRRHLSA